MPIYLNHNYSGKKQVADKIKDPFSDSRTDSNYVIWTIFLTCVSPFRLQGGYFAICFYLHSFKQLDVVLEVKNEKKRWMSNYTQFSCGKTVKLNFIKKLNGKG